MGSLSNFNSQEQGKSQGIKSIQVYHEVYGVQKHIFLNYQFLNSNVSREVYECGSANQHVCRSKRWRVFTKVWLTLGVGWPLGWSFRSCFSRGARCWSAPELWGVLPPHLFSCTCFIWHKEKQRQISAGLKNRGVQQFIGLYIFLFFYLYISLRKKIEIN